MKKHLHALTFTGWGQLPSALDSIVPSGIQITHFPYYSLADLEAVFAALEALPQQPDIVIGWSLGGRLAAHAIARQVLKPKLFVLIGSAFWLFPGNGLDNAVRGKANGFYEIYKADPSGARALLADIMVEDDVHSHAIMAALKQDTEHDADWLRWIVSARFHCNDINFSAMPRTLIVQGEKDALVNLSQAILFKDHIPNSRLEVLLDRGHLLHLHEPELVMQLIREELQTCGLMAGAKENA